MVSTRTAILFLAGIGLLLYSLSPGSIVGMGYTGEELSACREILSNARAALHGHPGELTIHWPRHGVLCVIFHMPWASLADPPADERVLAVEPIVMTALLLTVIFVWASQLTASSFRGYVLALVAGLCTLLWPYAYIGLETLQSLALLLAGFEALCRRRLTWPATIGFALAAAIAISAKLNGIALLPAAGYLIVQRFRDCRATDSQAKSRALPYLFVTVGIMAFVFLVNAHYRSLFWAPLGGVRSRLLPWIVNDPISPFLNFVGLFGSPNKGLILYAPVAVLGVLALPRVLQENKPIGIFAALTLLGLAGGVSFLRSWTDETWGPRYLHAAIGPLILCVAVLWRAWPKAAPFRALLTGVAVLGFFVSLLGVFFYYGKLPQTARRARQNTIEAYQGDPVLNHIRFNARLLGIWLGLPGTGAVWSPTHIWWVRPPENPEPWPVLDLSDTATPQPEVFRGPGTRGSVATHGMRATYLFSLGLGLLFLARVPFLGTEKAAHKSLRAP